MKYQLIGLLSPSRPVYKWRRAFWGRAGARTFVLFSSCQLQELACSLGGVYVFVTLFAASASLDTRVYLFARIQSPCRLLNQPG